MTEAPNAPPPTFSPADAEGLAAVGVLTIEGEEREGRLVGICDDFLNVQVSMRPLPGIGDSVVLRLGDGSRFLATCIAASDGVATLRLQASQERTGRRRRSVRIARADRARPSVPQACTLRTEAGVPHPCRVLDSSTTGALVETEAVLAEGETIRLGRAAATVVRVAEGGYGLRFASGARD